MNAVARVAIAAGTMNEAGIWSTIAPIVTVSESMAVAPAFFAFATARVLHRTGRDDSPDQSSIASTRLRPMPFANMNSAGPCRRSNHADATFAASAQAV